jgi:hypothetical protein
VSKAPACCWVAGPTGIPLHLSTADLQAKRLLKEMQAQSAAAEATRQLEVVMAKRPAGAGVVKAALSKAEAAASNLSSLGGASLAEGLIPRIQVRILCTAVAQMALQQAMYLFNGSQGMLYFHTEVEGVTLQDSTCCMSQALSIQELSLQFSSLPRACLLYHCAVCCTNAQHTGCTQAA